MTNAPANINLEQIPESLRSIPQWVAWRYVVRDGKPTKAPVSPRDGSMADTTSKSSWGTFDQAVEVYQRNRTLAGIGFVFSTDDPFCGIDLDNSIDEQGTIKPWASELLAKLDSYTEISPSRLGLKVFVKSIKHGKRCRKAYHDGEIEIYDRDRFFTVTGDRLSEYSSDINLRQDSLDSVYQAIFGRVERDVQATDKAKSSPRTFNCDSVTLSDDEIIHLACKKPRGGEKFQSLWDGLWNDYYNSASEADSSVVFTLAYYTKDAQQIDRIFRRSQLIRPKWDQFHGSQTYGELTIANALSKVTKQYVPKRRRTHSQRSISSGNKPPANLGFPKTAIDWTLRAIRPRTRWPLNSLTAINRNCVTFHLGKNACMDGKRWKVDIDSSRTTRLARRLVRNYWDRLQDVESEKQQKDWADFCRWANRKTTIDNVVSLARCDARTTIDHELLNQNPYFLNFQNGTLDLSTWEFRDHRQTDSITQLANVVYDPQAQCPKWHSFIDLIFGSDDEAKRYIQALLAIHVLATSANISCRSATALCQRQVHIVERDCRATWRLCHAGS